MDLLEFAIPFWGENHKLPDPDLVMFYKGLEDRDIWLDTEISVESCSLLIKYIHYLNRKQSFDNTPITLHIMSNGGELPTMFTLYHTIKNSEIPIHTINEGGAHSAAFIIFLAGHKRTMLPDATFIAHEGSGHLGGTFRETKSAMAQYEKDVDRMAALIAAETNLDKDAIRAKFDANSDWYIDYAEAERIGVIKE